jgi:hypothetical protein
MEIMRIMPFLMLAVLAAAVPSRAGEEFNLSLTGGNTSTYVWAKTEGTSSSPYITLKAKKGSLDPVVFFSKEINESNFEVLANVQLIQSSNAASEAGVMVRTSRSEGADWAKATLTKDNKILFQRKVGGVVEAAAQNYAIVPGKAVWFKAWINRDRVDFYISNTPSTEAKRWHRVGQPTFFPSHFFVGYCLIPKSGSTEDIGRVSGIEFRSTASSTGGLAKTSASAGWFTDAVKWVKGGAKATASGIVSFASSAGSTLLGAVDIVIEVIISTSTTVSVLDPSSLIPSPRNIEYFSPGLMGWDQFKRMDKSIIGLDPASNWGKDDAGLQRTYANVVAARSKPLVPITADLTETKKVVRSRQNLDIYLADVLVNLMTKGATPRLYPSVAANMVYFEFIPTKVLAKVDKAIKFCQDATEIEVYNPLDWISLINDIPDCKNAKNDAETAYNTYKQTLTGTDKDLIVLESTNMAFSANLLNVLDEDFHWNYYGQRKNFNQGLRDWVARVQECYSKNNIPIKAFAAIALGELPSGIKDTYNKLLRPAVEAKVDAEGVWAEGTGYLNYVNQELATLLSVAYDNSWLPWQEFPVNYTKTGIWLIKSSDPSGEIPAIDDGNGGRHFWLAPYTRLCNNLAFKAYTNGTYFQDDGTDYMVVRKYLSWPWGFIDGTVGFMQSGFYGSYGKLNVSPAAGENSTLTILAENGAQRTGAESHDQQDNSSITLNRHGTGPNVAHLVIDPAYGGYANHEKSSPFAVHNTVLISGSGVSGNEKLTAIEATLLLYGMFPNAKFVGFDFLPFLTSDNIYLINPVTVATVAGIADVLQLVQSDMPYAHAGGGDAYLDRKYDDGMVIKQIYDMAGGDLNRRAVFKYGKDFVVIDAILSVAKNYDVHYNLPSQTVQLGKNIYDADCVAGSRLRLAIFGEDEAYSWGDLVNHAYPTQGFDEAGNVIMQQVKRLHFRNSNATQTGGEFGYITVLSPRMVGEDIPYSYRKVACPNASVCVERSEPGSLTYFFLNDGPIGSPATVEIPFGPSVAGFATDARYGIVSFDTRTGGVKDARLYDFANASIGGVAAAFPGSGTRTQGTIANVSANGDNLSLSADGATATQANSRFSMVARRAVLSAVYLQLLN